MGITEKVTLMINCTLFVFQVVIPCIIVFIGVKKYLKKKKENSEKLPKKDKYIVVITILALISEAIAFGIYTLYNWHPEKYWKIYY